MSDMNDMIASISKQSNTFDEAVKILSLDVLRQACERNANLAVELAAMTQESDALRRENEMLREKIAGMKPVCGWRLVGAIEKSMRELLTPLEQKEDIPKPMNRVM